MPGTVKRSNEDFRKLNASKFEDSVVDQVLEVLGVSKTLKFDLRQMSHARGDGSGKKLADVYETIDAFPLLLGARKFPNIQHHCPVGKLFQVLPSLPPAKELQRIRHKYIGKRPVGAVGVVFPWRYMKGPLLLHTMPPNFSGEGTQLVHQVSADEWLVLEPFPRWLKWLSQCREEWDPKCNAGKKPAANQPAASMTQMRECE